MDVCRLYVPQIRQKSSCSSMIMSNLALGGSVWKFNARFHISQCISMKKVILHEQCIPALPQKLRKGINSCSFVVKAKSNHKLFLSLKRIIIKNHAHKKNIIQMIKHRKSWSICVEVMKSFTLLLIKNLIRTHANLTCFLGMSCLFTAQTIVTKSKNNC